jgi:hypothetical protein
MAGSSNTQNGYSTAWCAAFPYLNAINTAGGQPAQQPGPLQNTISGADGPGTEIDGYGISTSGMSNPGTGVEPSGKTVRPSQYLADLAANPNSILVSRAPSIIACTPGL